MQTRTKLNQMGRNNYEFALRIALAQVDSLDDEWPEFIDYLSKICHRSARMRTGRQSDESESVALPVATTVLERRNYVRCY